MQEDYAGLPFFRGTRRQHEQAEEKTMWDPETSIAHSITPRGRYRQNAPLVAARILFTDRVVRWGGQLRLFGRLLLRTSRRADKAALVPDLRSVPVVAG